VTATGVGSARLKFGACPGAGDCQRQSRSRSKLQSRAANCSRGHAPNFSRALPTPFCPNGQGALLGSIFTVPGCTRAPPTDPCPFGQNGVGSARLKFGAWPRLALAVPGSRSRSKPQSRAANSSRGHAPNCSRALPTPALPTASGPLPLPINVSLAGRPGAARPPPKIAANLKLQAATPLPRFRASTPSRPSH